MSQIFHFNYGTHSLALSEGITNVIDKWNEPIFLLIDSFIVKRLGTFANEDNVVGYQNFLDTISFYYEYALTKQGESGRVNMIKLCTEKALTNTSELILLNRSFENVQINNPIQRHQKEKSNRFSKLTLDKFSDLIYISIKYKQVGALKTFLNRLEQLENSSYSESLSSISDTARNPHQSISDGNDQPTDNFSNDINLFCHDYVRRLFKVTLYWIYFLYERNILKYDDLKELSSLFATYNASNRFNKYVIDCFFQDLLYLKSSSHKGEGTWDRWNYGQYGLYEIHSRPSPVYWELFGSVMYLIANQFKLNLDLDFEKILNEDKLYLCNSIFSITSELKSAELSRWELLFNIETREELVRRIIVLEQQVTEIKSTLKS